MSSLFGTKQEELKVQEIAVDKIIANRYQPRTVFEENELEELSDSIKQHGILQPIIVRAAADDKYEIVAGERRFRAAKRIGLTTVPVIVKSLSTSEAAVLALIENVQREDLSAIEEAKSYEQLANLLEKTQSEIAEMVGKSQPAVANKLRLLNLSDASKQAIEKRLITERHGRALLRIKNHTEQNQILALAIEKKMTVSMLDEYIAKVIEAEKEQAQGKKNVTIFGIAKDTKLAVNTINQAVHAIKQFGMPIDVVQEDAGENYEFTITIPKHLVEVQKKAPSFEHKKINYSEEELHKVVNEGQGDVAQTSTNQRALKSDE